MIDPEIIRKDPERIKKNTEERGMDSSVVTNWVEVDSQRGDLIHKVEGLRAERNKLSQNISGKPDEQTIERVKSIKVEIDQLEKELERIDTNWRDLINSIPNMHAQDVKIGKDDSENEVLEIIGEKPKFDFEPRDHLTIATDLNMIDFETATKVTGSQFYYAKNDLVLLEYALVQFGLKKFVQKGFELFITPDLAKSRFYLGTGYAPRGDEAQTYEIQDEDLGLIATAEVTMAGYHADQILELRDLPKKYVAISHCYRKEAGAYGKYSKGLYRVHQFTKMEMFIYCLPDQSESMHEELLNIEKEIASELGLHFRVIKQCTGDLGAMAYKKYDLEAWMPGRGDFGEITSTSNCTDYQSRNLNIKFRDEDGRVEYLHMLNGTAIVLSRFPLAIIENYQQSDGSIKVPDVLKEYIGKDFIKKK